MRRRLESDRPLRRFFEQETTEIPEYFVERIRKDLGEFWDWLPDGAISHDPNAYLGQQIKSVLPKDFECRCGLILKMVLGSSLAGSCIKS